MAGLTPALLYLLIATILLCAATLDLETLSSKAKLSQTKDKLWLDIQFVLKTQLWRTAGLQDCWCRARVASAAPLSIMRKDNSDSLVCGGALGVSIAIMWSVLFINKCHKRDTGSHARPSQLHYNYNIERWRENTPARSRSQQENENIYLKNCSKTGIIVSAMCWCVGAGR